MAVSKVSLSCSFLQALEAQSRGNHASPGSDILSATASPVRVSTPLLRAGDHFTLSYFHEDSHVAGPKGHFTLSRNKRAAEIVVLIDYAPSAQNPRYFLIPLSMPAELPLLERIRSSVSLNCCPDKSLFPKA